MFLLKRVLAQLIDFVVGLFIFLAIFVWLLPLASGVIESSVLRAVLGLAAVIGINYLVHYPFMLTGQTIGKAFFSLKIISTDNIRTDLPIPVVIQREILCKVASCYLICIPVLAGKLGGHEEATHTKLIALQVSVKR